MLTHWREEILNHLKYRATNGFAEGKNNRIKTIIRTGYGYRNLTNLTQRIMLANPHTPVAGEANSPHFLT
jgi:transposase